MTGWYVQPDELARSAKRGVKNSPFGRSAVASPQFESGQWDVGRGEEEERKEDVFEEMNKLNVGQCEDVDVQEIGSHNILSNHCFISKIQNLLSLISEMFFFLQTEPKTKCMATENDSLKVEIY